MNFSFRQLRAFLEVAAHGSFTKAAEKLHITQAGLSAMMRELEEQVGARLFERTTRSVRLTAAGEQLLPVAGRVMHELERTVGAMGSLAAASARRLRVGVTPLIACSVMPEVLRRFQDSEPEARVDIMDCDRALIQQHVESGRLDVGFGAFFSKVSGIRRRPVFPAHLVLAQPHAGRSAPSRVRWGAIDTRRLICLPPDNAIQKLVEQHLRLPIEGEAAPRVVTHLETVLAMVEAGLGQAVVPSFAGVAVRRWHVRLIPIVPVVRLDYYCITRAGQAESPLVARFAQAFRDVVAGEVLEP